MASLAILLLITSCVFVTGTSSQHMYNSEKLKEVTKEEDACAYSFLGLLTFGNMTVDKAVKEGGISEVIFVENKINNYILFGSNCTIVKGR